MSSTIDDEVLSVNAIYGDHTLQTHDSASQTFILKAPSLSVSLLIKFPAEYPDKPPLILGPESAGGSGELKKGEASEIARIAHDVLLQVYRAGEVCVYDLIEELANVLPARDDEDDGLDAMEQGESDVENNAADRSEMFLAMDPPPWSLSDVVQEKKSVFLARAAQVTSPAEARQFVQHLVTTDKKAAKATHNISAWRIRGTDTGSSSGGSKKASAEVVYQDCDDDGEAAAGGRLLHLLQLMELWNVLVIVSRWYGGIHLGPDRFRIINAVARDALLKGGFQSEPDPKKAQSS